MERVSPLLTNVKTLSDDWERSGHAVRKSAGQSVVLVLAVVEYRFTACSGRRGTIV